MFGLENVAFFWCIVLVQMIGVASTVFARVSEGGRVQAISQLLFFACLFLVGLATIATLAIGSICWLFCGATLSVMSVMVTLDLRQQFPVASDAF